MNWPMTISIVVNVLLLLVMVAAIERGNHYHREYRKMVRRVAWLECYDEIDASKRFSREQLTDERMRSVYGVEP